jgi:hypothetical protein
MQDPHYNGGGGSETGRRLPSRGLADHAAFRLALRMSAAALTAFEYCEARGHPLDFEQRQDVLAALLVCFDGTVDDMGTAAEVVGLLFEAAEIQPESLAVDGPLTTRLEAVEQELAVRAVAAEMGAA